MPPLLALHALPFFLLGLVLVYIFAFTLQVLPLYGGFTTGAIPHWSLEFVLDVLRHASCRPPRSCWSRSAAGRSGCAR